MSNEWLITKSKTKLNEFSKSIALQGEYVFYFNLEDKKYFYDESTNSGVFVFGYCIFRLSVNINLISMREFYFSLISDPDGIKKKIKGIYTIIIINNGFFTILNDPLGLSKYFYTGSMYSWTFSNSIKKLKDLAPGFRMSSFAILEYYIFNYVLNGHTFYENIFYSIPASMHRLIENYKIKSEIYFDLKEFLNNSKPTIKETEVAETGSMILQAIVEQYQQIFMRKNASLSLTAGLDSRIILGNFMNSGYESFDTFTFGSDLSSDVYYAKELAHKYSIPHTHYFPQQDFYDNFNSVAQEVFLKGDTLVSIYRAHRFDAYKKIMGKTHSVFMGLGGSDLVRGTGYDGLIVSSLAQYCFKYKSIEKSLKKAKIESHINNLGLPSLEYILDKQDEYRYLMHPLLYLFAVVIPMHFGQDVLLNMNLGVDMFVPFLDMDYIDFIAKTKYFQLDPYENYHFYEANRRINGLKYSANLLNRTNMDLSNFTTGKGYTPKDIIRLLPLIFIKKKIFQKSKLAKSFQPNFSYKKWYWLYLEQFITSNKFESIKTKQNKMLSVLNSLPRNGGELIYLDITKAINIQLASKV